MEQKKRIPPIVLEAENNEYTLDFNILTVKALAAKSRQVNGKLLVSDLIKYALKKEHEFDATDSLARNIYYAFQEFDNNPTAERSYMEMIEWLYRLFTQAIDDAASQEEPADITINKDGSVTVGFNGEVYRLTFTRSDLERAYQEGAWEYSLDNPLELYSAGVELIKLAMKNTGKHYSVKVPERMFLAMWRTALEPETKESMVDALNSLLGLRNDIINSGTKNSKAATIKLKM